MITSYAVMPEDVRAAVADLERRCVAHDGGRLKLEWGVLERRPSDGPVRDLVHWQDGRAIGFAGLYAFSPPPEVAGMVDPQFRRQGIATALVAEMRRIAAEGDYTDLLLVTPRTDAGGDRFAAALGARPDHSEYAMILRGRPADGPEDPAVTLRAATAADRGTVAALLQNGFGFAPDDLASESRDPSEQALVIEKDGRGIGYVRVSRDANGAGIYGFVVNAAVRGQGIGGDVLRRLCRQALADGAPAVRLEVAVDNPNALRLYTNVGFEPVTTEDYYRLPTTD